jgi:hypothetical protein
MAIVYSTTVKNSRLQAVIDALGAGALIVIGTSALSGASGVLASIPMASPSFTIASGVMTLASVPRSVVATGAGVAAKAELRTSGSVVVASGLTVGTSGADFIINATSISVGQTVQCTSGTITHG